MNRRVATSEIASARSAARPESLASAGMGLWLDMMNEGLRFFGERLQEDLEMQKAALECRTPGDLLQLQMTFWQTAASQYTAQGARMFDLISKLATEAGDGHRSKYARAYDDIPL